MVFMKKSFFEKVNSLKNEDEYLFSEDSCYGSRWIDNNEISFAKNFDLGDITGKSVSISGSDSVEKDEEDDEEDDYCYEPGTSSFTVNSNDIELYNNSFNSKGLFSQQKRISINYNKGLWCSINGIKVKQRNFSFSSLLSTTKIKFNSKHAYSLNKFRYSISTSADRPIVVPLRSTKKYPNAYSDQKHFSFIIKEKLVSIVEQV